MSFFVDRHNRRKSPLALEAFGAALLYLCVFGLLYALLAEPLYNRLQLGGAAATAAAHSVVIAALGTAVCCLLFFLKDKRVAPWGFAGLAVVLGMFYAAALMLEGEERSLMLRLITMYGLAPVLIGNAAAWPLYLKIRRDNPLPRHRKTLRQELMEEAAKETAKQERKKALHPESLKTVKPPETPRSPLETAEAPAPEKGLPEAGAFRSAEEEAMLLFMDDDDEESDD